MELQKLEIEQQEKILESNDLKAQLKRDPQVLQLVAKIDPKNQVGLLEFGREPANEISNFTGKILNTIKSSSMEESSELLKQLGKIMDKFDKKDFVEKPSFFGKIFKQGEKIIDKLFNKYQTMGSEIDKVFVEITKYEKEMKKSTVTLEELYNANFNYFMELEKYILAGELKVNQLRQQVPNLQQKAESGDQLVFNGIELTAKCN